MKKYFLGITVVALGLQSFSNLSVDDKMLIIDNNSRQLSFQEIEKGKAIYNKNCVTCHQASGQGVPSVFPPLAKSDYLNADVNRAIKQIIKGATGPMIVNGKKYNTPMPAQTLNDQQIADVLTYVYGSWGNSNKIITPEMVKSQRN